MIGKRTFPFVSLLVLLLLTNPLIVKGVDYPRLLGETSKSIVPINFTIKMTVTRQGKSNTRDLSASANGVLINEKGLLLMSARQLRGPAMFNRSNRRGINIETSASNFKSRMPDGTRLETTLSARDSGLDLAFLKINKPIEEYDGLRPVELPEEPPELEVGQRVIHVSRYGEGLNYGPQFLTTRLSSVVREPRLRYGLMDGMSMLGNYIGSAAYAPSGELVGIATFRGEQTASAPGGGAANPFTRMTRNKQFLLPVNAIKRALSNYASQ